MKDEWQYYIEGSGRMTVFGAQGKARTFDYQAEDVGYVPTNITCLYPVQAASGRCAEKPVFNSPAEPQRGPLLLPAFRARDSPEPGHWYNKASAIAHKALDENITLREVTISSGFILSKRLIGLLCQP